MIHRDIKPENILLDSGHTVVADFGIARAIHAAGGAKLTQTGVTLGTPFVPPFFSGSLLRERNGNEHPGFTGQACVSRGGTPLTGPLRGGSVC